MKTFISLYFSGMEELWLVCVCIAAWVFGLKEKEV